jgi:transposase
MFIDIFRNKSGQEYLRLVESIRVQNDAGKKVPQRRLVKHIGPLYKFDDGKPDYLLRLRNSFKAGQPLIDELAPFCLKKNPVQSYTFHFSDGDPACFGEPKLVSHLLIERIMKELGLSAFFASYKNFTKIEYNVYSFVRLMVAGRLLNPASKLATVKQNDDYYESILDADHNPDNIYDTLSFVADNQDKIIRRMNTNLMKKANRNPEVIFYDVTNFYYEIEDPDDDILNDEGEIIEKGLRKMGVSKEHRKQPIVQMGLFMDDNGIPIAIETFPGNTLDHLTLKSSLSKNIDNLELSRFILIADRGVCNYVNILHTTDGGNGYIMAKSLLKSNAAEREWAYEEDGFTVQSPDFKYKSRVIRRTIKDEYGSDREIIEKVVVYWSKHFADRSMKENKSFLEFLNKLMESPENFRVTATQSKSLKRFLSRDMVDKDTGEIVDSSKLKAMIGKSKVEAYKQSFGYYQLVTSELTMDEKQVIDKYHGLSQIENQFRIMKGDLQTRPLFVRSPEHIKAHLLICLIALTVMRIIQNKIVKSGLVPTAAEKDLCFTMGLSGERIQKALNKWQVEKMPGDYYRFLNLNDPDLKLILHAFGIDTPAKFFRRAELKQIKTGTENIM